MNRKSLLIWAFGLLIILTGVWCYPKLDQFFKIDSCLDEGGHWNYEKQECEFSEMAKPSGTIEKDFIEGYNKLAGEQNRKSYTVSEYNTDLEGTLNTDRPKTSEIINPTIDTAQLFRIWTLDPNGPHADFWFKRTDFYVVDYDGNGAMPYRLNGDNLTVYHNDYIQKGKIISVGKGTLIIHWDESESATEYVEWEN